MILRSPNCQVQAANEEAKGSRADEGLDVSERSAACLPQEKTLNKMSFIPVSGLHNHIQQEEKREKGMEKDESKTTEEGATDRGN